MLAHIKRVIPTQAYQAHKGQAGKICVIGGSLMYTGAPYFAGMSCLKMGADLVTVICAPEAGVPIKSYSPELMVAPLLKSGQASEQASSKICTEVDQFLARNNSMVIGPGLGRNPLILQTSSLIMQAAKRLEMPIVVDGDALYMLSFLIDQKACTHIVDYPRAILTPNAMEFHRIWKVVMKEEPPDLDMKLNIEDVPTAYPLMTSESATQQEPDIFKVSEDHHKDIRDTANLAKRLGFVTIVRKGRIDIITDGNYAVCCVAKGMPRRCGGQGDVLAGLTGLFSAWGCSTSLRSTKFDQSVPWTLVAGYAACLLTKTAARQAFARHKRATLASDLLSELGDVGEGLFPTNVSSL
eukprot:261971_1